MFALLENVLVNQISTLISPLLINKRWWVIIFNNFFTNVACFIFFKFSDDGVVVCGDGWFSKITRFIKVNAQQICIDYGYQDKITKYGGNDGVQCKHTSGREGDLSDFGYTVSWKCEGK